VFISYGAAADQVTALRLQALGAVNGLTVYLPPAYTRNDPTVLDPDASQKLHEAEVVLGVVEAGLSQACLHELNAGMALRKHLIVMSNPAFAAQFEPSFGSNLVLIDPANPGAAETGIMEYLKSIGAQQDTKKALLALGTLALGLLIFASADRD